MVVEADEGGFAIGLRHNDGGRLEPAADIRDFCAALERCLDAIEGWNLIGYQVAGRKNLSVPSHNRWSC
jgi:hypothetical protein